MGQLCCARRRMPVVAMPKSRAEIREAALRAAQHRAAIAGGGPADASGHEDRAEGLTYWQYTPYNGDYITVRVAPDIHAERGDHSLSPGEQFVVTAEKNRDGVLYLQLAGGRGWLFDHKPGEGVMCIRLHDSTCTSTMDAPQDSVVGGNGVRCRLAGRSAALARDAAHSRAVAVQSAVEAEAKARTAACAALQAGSFGVLQRFAVGVINEGLERRCCVNHVDFGQRYWNSGHLMNYAGFKHDLGFWAFSDRRPGTKRIAVGISGGRVTVGPERCLVNPSDRTQFEWDQGQHVDMHGFTPQLSFWAFSSPQPGTAQIAVYEIRSRSFHSLLSLAQSGSLQFDQRSKADS